LQSNMAYLADAVIGTIAGPEIGVASTKAYIAQLGILVLLSLKIAEERRVIDKKIKEQLLNDFANCPNKMEQILATENLKNIKNIAAEIKDFSSLLYMGRGVSYATALEGALKLKELSYINAFGIAAGELKHGTIALVDENMPIIALAPNNNLFEKCASNIEEVAARDGKVILIGNEKGIKELKNITFANIALPSIENSIEEALLCVIPTQLLAYYTANYKGLDVDQPRNLAKSVTVE
jgi:glutamine---fructose-6-phosphate transaminase (isomerizing)